MSFGPSVSAGYTLRMEVTVAHDWLDYVQAFGGVAAVVIAIVAAWFAAKSARDASRSSEAAGRTADAAERTADAAEETAEASKVETEHSQKLLEQMQIQLELQKKEHELIMEERNLRPELHPILSVEKMETSAAGPTSVQVKFGSRNSGRETAEQALLLQLVAR